MITQLHIMLTIAVVSTIISIILVVKTNLGK